ncbi:MAG: hypothetical protein MJE77_29910, partial [Proteobacteria bacterium]|nr:hypothetical protein [Pseudomonadota bacterium]
MGVVDQGDPVNCHDISRQLRRCALGALSGRSLAPIAHDIATRATGTASLAGIAAGPAHLKRATDGSRDRLYRPDGDFNLCVGRKRSYVAARGGVGKGGGAAGTAESR